LSGDATGERAAMTARQTLLLALGVVVVSFAAPLIRLADEAPPLAVAMYRNVFASAILFPLAVVRHREELRALRRGDVLALAGAGVLLAVHFGSWVPSVTLTTVAASTVLVSTQPLWSAVLARIFLRERVRRGVAVGIGVAFGGAVLISGFDFTLSARAFVGDLLALTGAAAVAGHRILALGPRRRLSLLPVVAVMYGVCALVLGLVVLISGTRTTGFEGETWLWMLLMALGPQVVGHTLFNLLLRDVDPTVLAVAIMGEAVGATLLALGLFGEVPPIGSVFGGVLLLAGIFVAVRAQSRRALEAPVE
jgi:drug/metabolite transporter (DMT)-like permease